MPRIVVTGALWLGIILSCGAMLIYAMAHTDGDYQQIRTFLYPVDGCLPPCWQGIRPGVTDSLEAVDRLQALPWVASIYSIQGIVINDSYASWKWNGYQPDIVDSERDGRIWFHNGLVYSIEIPLLIPFAAVWGAFGAPESETTLKAPFKPSQVFYGATYFAGTVEFNGLVLCPPNARNLLVTRVDVNIVVPQKMPEIARTAKRLGCENAQR